ncbi:hypothetical protein HS088_TW22G00043 [Tripterygium wilfordii]|uniref:Uncharacterized protein n=1 Tax=Tripterygium wilfordii TaxID=458696 RepID=A0A7J7BXU5_TRIWF|nr:hypothetical protein HS088_TW22G00043 [Tripterygium wilfordii]
MSDMYPCKVQTPKKEEIKNKCEMAITSDVSETRQWYFVETRWSMVKTQVKNITNLVNKIRTLHGEHYLTAWQIRNEKKVVAARSSVVWKPPNVGWLKIKVDAPVALVARDLTTVFCGYWSRIHHNSIRWRPFWRRLLVFGWQYV